MKTYDRSLKFALLCAILFQFAGGISAQSLSFAAPASWAIKAESSVNGTGAGRELNRRVEMMLVK